MEYSTRKRIGAFGTTVPVLLLAVIIITSPSASAALLPIHRLPVNHQMVFKHAINASPQHIPRIIVHPNIGLPVNHQMVFKHAITASPQHIPRIIVHPNIGLPVNHQMVFKHALKLHDQNGNSNLQISKPISSLVVVNRVTQTEIIQHSTSDKETNENENSNNDNDNHDDDNNNNNNDNNNNHHNSLDVQDKSFIKDIKITDVDRTNPHLLKVTLERTHNDNGNIPKYISVVAVSKNDQTVAGSTTLKGDDINNSLTVNVVLKNKNNKNGHLDESANVIVWVVPATLHDISSSQ
jgi:sRNA-binding regulator protein Hfq